MVSAAATFFLENFLQHLSFVWIELTLAGIAAIAYLLFGKAKSKSKDSKMSSSSGSPHSLSPSSEPELTPAQLATKALRQGKLVEAIDLIEKLPETAAGSVPDIIAHRLLIVATRAPRSSEVMSRLKSLKGTIQARPLEVALADALKNEDRSVGRQLHVLCDFLSIPKNPAALDALVSINSSDMSALRMLLKEVEAPLPSSFAKAMVESCAKKDTTLLEEVIEMAASSDVELLRDTAEKVACVPEAMTIKLSSGNPQSGSEGSSCASESPRTSASADPALNKDVAKYAPSQKEVAMRANDIRSCGKNGDLRGAVKVFDRLGSQAENTLLVNSMLDACVECNDINMALTYFTQAQKLSLADVVSYNTMMKGYIAHGREAEAKSLLVEISKKGMVATRASFHGLLNARVNARDLRGAWKLVEDMQAVGIQPNAVTCSILLKSKLNSLADVSRVLALIDAMDQPMDEVLFLSVVEACIRTGRLDLLSRQTEKYLSQQGAKVCLTAPTFGSMIKAYGHARDVKRVWELWGQMLSHNVQPTAVTLGCMTEALVANGCTSDAWQLAQKMWNDKDTRPLVNTVIYSSILKGFANAKETDKVMALYEEMRAHGVQPNTITFNTILNAFAQGGAMRRVPALLDDMKAASPPIEPDIVTYSTIIKGFCNSGSLDRALKVLEDMKSSGKYSPDEVMYNSLLSGCAKEHRPDEALQLLVSMKKSGVAPSNYTLSMLVKLMGRCRRLNQAFTMLDDISKEYNFKINIQVYTCLIQGCFNGGQAHRALTLHDKIIREGLFPDAMTYTVLVRGCLQAGMVDKAVEMVKCAHGLKTDISVSKCTPPGLAAGCLDEVIAALGGAASESSKILVAQIDDLGPVASMKAADSRPNRRVPARGPPQRSGYGGQGAKKGADRSKSECNW
jgi:pentatricopeptide repeat protein